MSELFTTENLIAFLTLASLEIVLGIDNVVFISILAGKLPEALRPKARFVGLALAMVMRIGLLFSISWIVKLVNPLFTISGLEFTGQKLILLFGGLFLMAKATWEIHDKLEGSTHDQAQAKSSSFGMVIFQILILDLVFSLDSVITAVGMAKSITVMVAAVIVAVIVMMLSAGAICNFIERHPTMKMLALSFLLLIGLMLFIEGFGKHIEKGYLYFAMAFSLGVELLNMLFRRRNTPVELRHTKVETKSTKSGA